MKAIRKSFTVAALALVAAMAALFAPVTRVPVKDLKRSLRRAFYRKLVLRLPYWAARPFVPAISGAADDVAVVSAEQVFINLTAGSTDLKMGDLVYFDGTDWEKADATDNTKFAELVCLQNVLSGKKFAGARRAILSDADAPYTQGDQYYLSATAGAHTATRPTGAVNLVQVIGYGISTSLLAVEIGMVKELTLNLTPMADGTAAFTQVDDYTGVLLGAAAEAAGYTFMVPQNCVGLEIAYLWWTNPNIALDTGDTYTIDVSAGVDDETNTATQDGITATALTVAADDLARGDVTAAFNASGIIEPGNIVGVDVDKAAEGTAGDDPVMLACAVVLLVV